ELAWWRLAIELPPLVAWAIEGDRRLAVVNHESAEERRQQAGPVSDDACHHLLGIKGRALLAEVDVAVDLAQTRDDGKVGNLMRIGQRPKRRPKADVANRTSQL